MSDEAMINNIVRTRKDRREAQKVDNEARLKQLFATVPLVNKELVDTVNRYGNFCSGKKKHPFPFVFHFVQKRD